MCIYIYIHIYIHTYPERRASLATCVFAAYGYALCVLMPKVCVDAGIVLCIILLLCFARAC